MEITDASTNWFNHNNGINVAELIKVLCSAIGTSDKKVIHQDMQIKCSSTK